MPIELTDIEVCIAPGNEDLEQKLESLGFTQDPDVLDTWFSSWLWPFATMGWPEQTDTLKKFYPTTDLVTGPDIIFFWVARMIMAGYEYNGRAAVPECLFHRHHPRQAGRKMSKSLGQFADPLDLIAKFGADALRFGVMRAAPLGQDILFDEQNVELGRNFCNKLWNACRFRQMQGSAGGSPANEGVPPSSLKSKVKSNRRCFRAMKVDFAQARRGHPRSDHRVERIQIQRRQAALYPLFLERILRLVCRGEQGGVLRHGR